MLAKEDSTMAERAVINLRPKDFVSFDDLVSFNILLTPLIENNELHLIDEIIAPYPAGYEGARWYKVDSDPSSIIAIICPSGKIESFSISSLEIKRNVPPPAT